MTSGYCINWRALWVGVHYSSYNRRVCINLVPCFTVWICFQGGKVPLRSHR